MEGERQRAHRAMAQLQSADSISSQAAMAAKVAARASSWWRATAARSAPPRRNRGPPRVAGTPLHPQEALLDGGIRAQLLRRALELDAPLIHHVEPVREAERHLQRLLHEENRGAPRG